MDPWTDPDSQNDQTRDAMIARLEDRGRHPMFLQFISNYASTILSGQGVRVLEIGCGTGAVLRQIVQSLDAAVEVHGADISDALLDAARMRDAHGRIHWQHIGVEGLPYEGGYFDVIVMHTLLSHVPDPGRVLGDAKRCLKANGRLIIFDADHAGTTYSLEDYQQSRRIDHLLTSAIATQPDICRKMPRLLKNAGFAIESHRADVISECGKGDYWLSSVRGFEKLIPALGVMAEAEGKKWVEQMLLSHENGTFFAAGTFYTFNAVPL